MGPDSGRRNGGEDDGRAAARLAELIDGLRASLGPLAWDDLAPDERQALLDLLEVVEGLTRPEWPNPPSGEGHPHA